MKNIKTSVAAAILAMAGTAACAQDFTLTVTPQPNEAGDGWSAWLGVVHTSAGAFVDTFEFGSFGQAVLVEATLSSINLSLSRPWDVDFQRARLSNGVTAVDFSFQTLVPGYDYGSTVPTVFAANLPLTLTVHGIAAPGLLPQDGNPSASYGGSLNFSVTAVPEPGTAAMLFAGLATIGWLASRRRPA
jgi:hypothetical protein